VHSSVTKAGSAVCITLPVLLVDRVEGNALLGRLTGPFNPPRENYDSHSPRRDSAILWIFNTCRPIREWRSREKIATYRGNISAIITLIARYVLILALRVLNRQALIAQVFVCCELLNSKRQAALS